MEVLLPTSMRICRRLVVSVVVACCALLAADGALQAERPASKRDAALRGTQPRVVRVIITTQPDSTSRIERSLRARGRRIVSRSSLLHAVAAQVTRDDLADLEADAGVIRLSADARVWGHAAGSDTAAAPAGSQAALGLAGGRWTGEGVGIAVVDSGLKRNGDFSRLTDYDFTANAGRDADAYGHGTHISGLIGSKGALSQGAYTGVAPRARIISLKVLDRDGRGYTSDVIAAIEFAIRNRRALGIDVLNLSLGHPILEPAATDPLVRAVEAAVQAGVVVVVSAGNAGRSLENRLPGYAGILSPANAPSAITVGALDTMHTARLEDDVVAAYSSRGPTWYDAYVKPDVVAPGHNLVSDAAVGSTLYLRYPERRVTATSATARFFRMSGTSMAAGVTSGVAALLIEAGRSLTGAAPAPATVKQILAYSALPLSGVDRLTQGHGAVNASGALELMTAVAATGSPIPDAVSASDLSPATTIEGTIWPWNQTTVADQTMVWGNIGIWASTIVWGNTMVWGNDEDTMVWGNLDDTMVWGNDDTMVWGNEDTMVWGNTGVWGNTDDSR